MLLRRYKVRCYYVLNFKSQILHYVNWRKFKFQPIPTADYLYSKIKIHQFANALTLLYKKLRSEIYTKKNLAIVTTVNPFCLFEYHWTSSIHYSVFIWTKQNLLFKRVFFYEMEWIRKNISWHRRGVIIKFKVSCGHDIITSAKNIIVSVGN